jgi:dihydroflavonol-4-reductase
MRVFLTGGNGFIGGRVAARLLARGDEVVAAVRDPGHAAALAAAGATLLESDLSDVAALASQMANCDAVVHSAGVYRVGIAASERANMWDGNVGTTERVLDAAAQAGIRRIVYVSTANVFGNTQGRIVDEAYRRDPRQGFLSCYDETKYRAHAVAIARIEAGAPIVVALPTAVYGPGDRSQAGALVRQAFDGTLGVRALEEVGMAWVHVDDLAAGVVALLDRGRVGESYVLGGPTYRLAEVIEMAAALGGRRLPRLRVPTVVLRVLAPIVARLPRRWVESQGLPPNLGEAIRAAAGVTYWASAGKAERELGFTVRDLETGLRETLVGASG